MYTYIHILPALSWRGEASLGGEHMIPFLSLIPFRFATPAEPYVVNPIHAAALETILVLHADHEQVNRRIYRGDFRDLVL